MKRFLLAIALSAAGLWAEVPSAVAIRNARIVTVSGATIEKGTILLRNGLIEAVGATVVPPPDAWVIEGAGLTVYPGLIDALSTLGLDQPVPTATAPAGRRPLVVTPAPPTPGVTLNVTSTPIRGPEDRPSTNSWVRAADLVKTTDRRIETARSAGFTSAVTFPTSGIFAGQGDVVNLGGDRAGQMILAGPVGQYITFASGGFQSFPGSLMGVIAYVRQVYLDAEYYKQAKAAYDKNPAGLARPEYDRALEGVLSSPRILLPARRRVEIDRIARLAADLKQPAILYGLSEGYRSTDLLRKANLPVLISLKWPEKDRDSDPADTGTLRTLEQRDQAPATPAALAKAGVKFAFYAEGQESRADLLRAVKRALDAGLTPQDAIRAFTLSAAEIFGVASRVGSVEKGKVANLVVTRGDLFDEKSKVEYVFVDGRKYGPAAEAPTGSEELR